MTEKWSTAGGSKPLSYADLLRKAKEAKSGGEEQQQSSTTGTTSASASATALSPPPNVRPPTFSSPSFPKPGMPLSPSSKPADSSTAGTPRTILSSPAGKAPAPRQHSHDASPLRAPQPNGIVKDHPTSSPSASGPQASPPLSSDNKSPTKSTAPSPNIWEVRRQQRAAAQAQLQQTTTPVRPPARAATEPTAVVGALAPSPAKPQDSSSVATSAKPAAEETATKQTEAAKQPASAPAPSTSMIKDTSASTSTPPKGPKLTTTTFDGNVWQRPSSSAGTPAAPTAQSKTPAIREGEDDNAWLSRVAMMNEGHHMLKKDRGASVDGSGDDAKTPRKTAWGRFGALASPTPSPRPPAAASSSSAAAANPPPQTPPPASASNAGKAAQKPDNNATPSASSTRPSTSTAPSKSDWPSLDEAERERPSTSSTSHGAAPPSFHPPGSTGSSTPVSVGGGSAGSASGGGSNLDAIKGVVQIKNPAGQRKGGKNWVEIVPEITHSGPTPSRRNVLRGWAGKPGQQDKEKEKGGASSSTSRSRESTERAGAGQSGAATSSIQILGASGKGAEQKAHASSEGNKAAEEPRSSDTWDDEPPAPSAPTSRRGLHSPRSRQYKTPYPRRFGPPNADAEPETSTAAATSDKAPTVQPAHPTPSSMRLNSDGSFSPARLTSARAQPYSRSKQEWEARSGMGRGRSASSFSEHDGGSSAAGGPYRRSAGHGHGESMSSSINDVPHGNHRHSHAPQGSMDQSGTYWDPSMPPMPPHHFVAGHESFSSPHEIPYGHPMMFDGTRFWPAFPVPHHPDFGAPYHHGPPIPSPQHHPSQAQHWHGPSFESGPASDPQQAQRQAAPPNNAPPTAPDGPSGQQPTSEPPLQTPELPSGVAQLVGQVEWYCSSQNLAGDNFLRSQMDPTSGWIPLSLIASFRRLRSMCEEVGLTLDHPDVQAALAASQYVELDDEGKRIRKRNDWAEWVLQPPRTPAMSNPGVASYVQPGAVPAGHHSSAPPVPNMSSSYDGPVVGSPRPLAPHAYYGQPGEDQAYPPPPPPPPPAQAHPPPGMNFYPPTQPQPQHFYHAPQHPIYQSAPPNLTPTGPAAYGAIPPYAPAAMGAPQHPHHHHHHHHGIDHLTTTPRDVPTWRGAPAPMHWSRQDGLYSPVEAGHAAAANAASAAQYGSAAHQPQSQHHSVAPRAPRQSLPTSASLPPHPDHHLHQQQQQQQQQRGVLPVDLPGSRRNVAAAAAASSSQDELRLPPSLQSPTHHQIQPHAQPQPQPTFVRHASQQTDITTTSTSSSGLDATPSAAGGSGGGSGSGSGAANTATTAPTTTRTNSSVSVSLSLGAHSPSSPTSPASNRSGGGGGGGVMIGEDGPTSSPSPTRRAKPPGLGHAQVQGQMSPTTLSRQHQKLANVDANHKKGNNDAAAAVLTTGGARTSAHAASHHIRQREGSGDGAAAAGGGGAGGAGVGGDDSEDDCLGIVAAEGLGGLVEAKAKRTAAA